MEKIYIVTGASGFLGREVCCQLLSQGKQVRTLSRKSSTRGHIPEGVKIFAGNILDADSIDRLFASCSGPEIVAIHCAGKISVRKHDKNGYLTNVEGTRNMINACRKYSASKLVYVSSVDALFNPGDGEIIYEPEVFYLNKPETDYARGKCDASALVMKASGLGLNSTVVMPSCIIGPGDYTGGLVTTLFTSYIKGIPPVSISGGYDFVDVRDVAAGIILAADKAANGTKYILSGTYRSVTEVFDIMSEELGKKKTKVTFPAKLLYPASPVITEVAAIKHAEPALTSSAIKLLESRAVFSHEKAEKELGYTIRPIEKTIEDTVKFLRETRNI